MSATLWPDRLASAAPASRAGKSPLPALIPLHKDVLRAAIARLRAEGNRSPWAEATAEADAYFEELIDTLRAERDAVQGPSQIAEYDTLYAVGDRPADAPMG